MSEKPLRGGRDVKELLRSEPRLWGGYGALECRGTLWGGGTSRLHHHHHPQPRCPRAAPTLGGS